MPWWVPALVVIYVAKKIYDAVTEEYTPIPTKQSFIIPESGNFSDNKIVVLGRTGAGKSSMINALQSDVTLDTGDISSTTRVIHGVVTKLNNKEVNFIDTPGIGEAGHQEYAEALVNWCKKNANSISCIIFAIQADSKAHSEEKELFQILFRWLTERTKFMIVLTQIDKIPPTREFFSTDNWENEKKYYYNNKVKNVIEKISVISEQFNILSENIIPISVPEIVFNSFNIKYLKYKISFIIN